MLVVVVAVLFEGALFLQPVKHSWRGQVMLKITLTLTVTLTLTYTRQPMFGGLEKY